uniref:AMP-dependent synthetase/ligase domain-containing protein n=1 Tax=Fagus sylvatica TaxID=28930 RepID=A0A2N9FLW1_FAGSY
MMCIKDIINQFHWMPLNFVGKCLTRNQKQPSYLISMLDWLWARFIAAILWPVHMLAKKIVYSKIHSAIGISKAGVSGGGSLPLHVDKFFEAIGVKVQNGYGLTESSPVVAARRPTCNESFLHFSDAALRLIFTDLVESLENAGEVSVLPMLRSVRLALRLFARGKFGSVVSSCSGVDVQVNSQLQC